MLRLDSSLSVVQNYAIKATRMTVKCIVDLFQVQSWNRRKSTMFSHVLMQLVGFVINYLLFAIAKNALSFMHEQDNLRETTSSYALMDHRNEKGI